MFQRDDWTLFLDIATLPQKAGCHPDDLAALVIKEIVDNALDSGDGRRDPGRSRRCGRGTQNRVAGPGLDALCQALRATRERTGD